MADEQRHSGGDRDPKKATEFRIPPRTWIVWILILGGIVTLMMFRDRMDTRREELNPQAFLEKVDSNLIVQATVANSPQSAAYDVTGFYFKTDSDGNKVIENGKAVEMPFHSKLLLTDELVATSAQETIWIAATRVMGAHPPVGWWSGGRCRRSRRSA